MSHNIIENHLEFLVRKAEATFGYSLWVIDRQADSQTQGQLIMEPYTEGDYVRPTVHLDQHQCQSLMDCLWECGIRPSEGTGSAGAMAAVERHRDDLQRMVFEHFLPHLNLEKPE